MPSTSPQWGCGRLNRHEVAERVANLLTEDPKDRVLLWDAVNVAYYDGPLDIQAQLQAYSILGTYYAIVKDKKRQVTGATNKWSWMLIEDAIEGWLKALDRGIIATQHLNNLTGRHNI